MANWYKQSQVKILDREDHEENYFDIGHLRYWDRHNEKLEKYEEKTWLWARGVLYVCDVDVDHDLCARQNIKELRNADSHAVDEYMYTVYKGRFGDYNGTKFVSMMVPANRMFAQIPSALIRDLTQQFGDDITIYRFN